MVRAARRYPPVMFMLVIVIAPSGTPTTLAKVSLNAAFHAEAGSRRTSSRPTGARTLRAIWESVGWNASAA